MCRNIRTLHNFEPPATEDEVRAAALQYVRKISGFTKPSRANAEAFERAVDCVAAASGVLLSVMLGLLFFGAVAAAVTLPLHAVLRGAA